MANLDAEAGVLLQNCNVITMQGDSVEVTSGMHILILGKRIAYVGHASPSDLAPASLQTIDIHGAFVLPGLCDAHVHVTAVTANLHDLLVLPPSLVTARATAILEAMLMRGFTTVRDAGGCDWGLAAAVAEGTIRGPRVLFCGRALSQTGGHGDMRLRGEDREPSCCPLGLGRVCDGVAEVRLAAREELRRGAHHVKIMASGGVSSPTDRLANLQFSDEEIAAIVEEARHAGTYVCAHAYTAPAIKRCLELGVRSIEHGNYIDMECAEILYRRGAFLVPTLVTYDRIKGAGEESGMPREQVAKVSDLLSKGLEGLALADKEGVNICFGSDLLGSMHKHQLEEFAIRYRVQSPASVLRSATTNCAKLFNMEGDIGVVAPGAFADLVVLSTNPLTDNLSLSDPSRILVVMKEGVIVKRMHL